MTNATVEQYCKHKDKDYTVKVGDDMQDVCESCSFELTHGVKRRETMKKGTDAPPTLEQPKAKITRKTSAGTTTTKPNTRVKHDAPKLTPKEKLAALKAKKHAEKPAARITFGVKQNDHYVFTKMNFDDPQTALSDVAKLCQARLGKGLREVIITFRD